MVCLILHQISLWCGSSLRSESSPLICLNKVGPAYPPKSLFLIRIGIDSKMMGPPFIILTHICFRYLLLGPWNPFHSLCSSTKFLTMTLWIWVTSHLCLNHLCGHDAPTQSQFLMIFWSFFYSWILIQ